jgi:hypothetical protein
MHPVIAAIAELSLSAGTPTPLPGTPWVFQASLASLDSIPAKEPGVPGS